MAATRRLGWCKAIVESFANDLAHIHPSASYHQECTQSNIPGTYISRNMLIIRLTSPERHDICKQWRLDCLRNLFRLTIKKTPHYCPCVRDSASYRWFPSERASKAESVSMSCHHHVTIIYQITFSFHLNDHHAQISMVTRVATEQLLIGLFREIKRNYIIQSCPYGVIHETREDYMYSGNNYGRKHAALWDTNDKTSWQSAMPNQHRNRKVWQHNSVWICEICTWFCYAWSYLGYNILVLQHAFNSKLVTVTHDGFITTMWWYSSQIIEIHI